MRTPGDNDDEPLNNADQGPGAEAAEQERLTQLRVAQAKLEEEQTQSNQVAAQKKSRKAPTVGTVAITAAPARKTPQETKYGPELPFAEGTRLTLDKGGKIFRPIEGGEQPTHVSARVLGPTGWLVQRAIPIEEAMAGQAE